MKAFLYTALLLVLAGTATAELSDYPKQFISGGDFDGQIIVGNDAPSTDTLVATEIALSLLRETGSQIRAETAANFDPDKNAILIGLPCENEAIEEVLNTNACNVGLESGQGLIKLVEGKANYLIVTGSDAAATRKAGRLLAEYGSYDLEGMEMRIGGTLQNPEEQLDEPVLVIEEIMVDVCETNDDCADIEVCDLGQCRELGCPKGSTLSNHTCTRDEPEPEVIPEPTPIAEPPPVLIHPEPVAKPQPGFFERILNFIKGIFS